MTLKTLAALMAVLLPLATHAGTAEEHSLDRLQYVAVEGAALSVDGEFGPGVGVAAGLVIPMDEGDDVRPHYTSLRVEAVSGWQKTTVDGPTKCRTETVGAGMYRPPPERERCKTEQEALHLFTFGGQLLPTVNLKDELEGYAGGGMALGVFTQDGDTSLEPVGQISAGFRHPVGGVLLDIGYRGTISIGDQDYESHGVALRVDF